MINEIILCCKYINPKGLVNKCLIVDNDCFC